MPSHKEQLAAIKRPDELTRLQSEVARLRLKLNETELDLNIRLADLDDARECLALSGLGDVFDIDLWASMKRQRDRAVVALRDLYDDNPVSFRLSAACRKAAVLLKELEPESEESDA